MKKNDITNQGRTMIEVVAYLGIAAIISIGIYMGYVASMRRIKVDMTINLVRDLIQDIRTAHNVKKFYTVRTGAQNFVNTLIRGGVISSGLCAAGCSGDVSNCNCAQSMIDGDSGQLKHPLGRAMAITLPTTESDICMSNDVCRNFDITLYGLTRQTCFPVVSSDWNNVGETINVVESISINDNTPITKFPITMEDVKTLCFGGTSNKYKIRFRIR